MLHTAPGSPNILVAGTGPRPLEDPKKGKHALEQRPPDFVVARPDSRRVVINAHNSGDYDRPWTCDNAKVQRDKGLRTSSKGCSRWDSAC